jgi:hypothetical protein
MKIHQLSLFLENRAGQLRQPIKLLGQAGIDIRTLMLADTQQFGILRIIVQDWQKAKQVLEAGSVVVNVTEVVACEVADRPGGLDEILSVIEQSGMNVEYMYAFAAGTGSERAIMIFRFEDADAAVKALTESGINVLDSVALFESVEH